MRTPSDIEDTLQTTTLASTSPVAFNQVNGDGKFTSETLIGYGAGYRSLVTRSFSLDLTAFYNQYNHLVSLEPGGAPFTIDDQGVPATIYPFINGNGIRGTTYGLEIAADWKPKSWWRLESSYSWLQMSLHDTPTSKDTTTVALDEGTSPHHQAQLQSYFDISRNLEFTVVFRYTGALPSYLVGGYETGDVRVAWRPVRNIEFAVSGRNLLQPRHFEYGGDPGPLIGIKRNILASLTFRK